MSGTTKNPEQIAAVLRTVGELVATGLPVPSGVHLYYRVDMQFSHGDVAAVDAWASAIGATVALDPTVYAEGATRAWQSYDAEGTVAGYPVRVWTSVAVTR